MAMAARHAHGGVGNDNLIGGAGDTLRGGADNDTYYVEDSSAIVEEIDGEGVDNIQQNTATYVMTAFVENGTMLAPAVSLTGNALANSLIGNAGANTIDGGDGADKIQAGDGNDTLIGGNGNDQLVGGAGADGMTGGLGHDHYFVENVGDTIVEVAGTGEGNDSIYYSGSTYTLADNVGVENVWFQAGAQSFTGNNLAQAFAGNDIANTINGGGGNDVMSGNGGNDILFGGTGTDIVFGNAGADKFAFNALAEGGAGDRIADFSSAQGDQIQIDDTGFGISSITLASGATVGAASYGATTGAFFLDNAGGGSGNLYFDADGDGAGAAALLTNLTGVTSLTTTDFLLV